jgi:hypothetical protein
MNGARTIRDITLLSWAQCLQVACAVAMAIAATLILPRK